MLHICCLILVTRDLAVLLSSSVELNHGHPCGCAGKPSMLCAARKKKKDERKLNSLTVVSNCFPFPVLYQHCIGDRCCPCPSL